MKKIRKLLLTLLCVIICIIGTVRDSYAAVATQCVTYAGSNEGDQDQAGYGSSPIRSYLHVCSDGSLMRVQAGAVSGKVLIEYYDTSYNIKSTKTVDIGLPLFGGFYSDGTYYYILSGKSNTSESDATEVYRVTKYNTSWTSLGSASLKGANTKYPFSFGTARFTSSGNYLVVRTCHTMYKTADDGLNHQANVTFEINTSTMTVTDSHYSIASASSGYVSHSFNQFIQADGSNLVAVDHGDAYPRSVCLTKYPTTFTTGKFQSSSCKNVTMLAISGAVGDNYTGVSVGGFEVSSSKYIVVGNTIDQSNTSSTVRNIFVSTVGKTATGSATVTKLTNYTTTATSASTPHLVKFATDSYLVMWTSNNKIYYTKINGSGTQVGSIYSMDGKLSDCVPIVTNGKVIWYTWNNETVTFYSISTSSLSTVSSTPIVNGHKYVLQADTDGDGSTTYKCSVCGAAKDATVPASISSVRWTYNSKYSTATSQEYQEGNEVALQMYYTPSSVDNNDFTVEIADSTIATYTKGSNGSSGTIKMLKRGTTTVKVYPTYNPKAVKTFNLKVIEAGGHQYVINIDEDGDGNTTKVCSICGDTQDVTVPKSITRVTFTHDGTGYYSPVAYEAGDEVSVQVTYSPSSVDNKDFTVEIADPTIAKYTPGTYGYKGTLTMLQPGDTTIKVYPTYNPNVYKTYTLEVTEAGGHHYVIAVDEDGDGHTTKTCSGCGKTVDITVPTSITRVSFTHDGTGYYSPTAYEAGEEVSVQVTYSPTSVNNKDFSVEITDPAIASYTPGSNGYTGTLKMLQPGETTIKVYATYNPSVYKTYTLEVTEVGGHNYVIAVDEDGDGHTTKTCSNCGKTVEAIVPSSVSNVRFTYNSSSSYSLSQAYELGSEVSVQISYSPSTVDNKDFKVEIADPTIASYTPGSNGYTGTLKMLKQGETTIKVYPTYNPSVYKTYTLEVIEVGGHNFVMNVDEDGDGNTTKTCLNCGKTVNVTVPTSISSVTYSYNGASTASLSQIYEIGTQVSVSISYSPSSAGNKDFTVEVEDSTIASYTPGSYGYKGTLTMLKQGVTTIKVYPTYNPNVSKTYTLEVTEAGGHDYVMAVDEDGDGNTTKTCSKCGKTVEVTVPTSISQVSFHIGNVGNSSPSQSYEVGSELTMYISYSPSSVDNKDFTVEIADSTIASYTRGTLSTRGTLKLLQAGETTVKVYPTYNPSVYKTYNLEVTEDGGHNYVIAVDEDGDGNTTKTCSKCGKTVDVTVPTSISQVYFYLGNSGSSSLSQSYEVGSELTAYIYYSPSSVDNKDFTVEIADPTIASYTRGTLSTRGTLKLLQPGDTTIKIYPTYNPSASKTYNLEVIEEGGHDFELVVDEDGDGKTIGICKKCQKNKEFTVSTSVFANVLDPDTNSYNSSGWNNIYSVGDEITMRTYCSWANNMDYVMEISDPTMATYSDTSATSNYYYRIQEGTLTLRKEGIFNVTVYAKYNPAAKSVYTVRVGSPSAYNIQQAEVALEKSEYEYDPARVYPLARVVYNGVELTLGTDYYLTQSNNLYPGTGTVTVTGRGIFTGSVIKEFTITKKNISDAVITLEATEVEYDGTVKTPTIQSVKVGGYTTSLSNYSIAYSNNREIGTATVTVSAKADNSYYTGTATTTFEIKHTQHVFDDWYVKTAATCETSGLKRRDCRFCDEFETEEIEPLGHDYQIVYDWAEDGSSCSAAMACQNEITVQGDYSNKQEIPSADVSTPVLINTKDATCSKNGVKTYKVTVTYNGNVYTDTKDVLTPIEPSAHPEDSNVVDPAVAPTCTETGLTEGSHCRDCHTVFVAQKSIPAIGHAWKEPVYRFNPENMTGDAEFICANDNRHKEIVSCEVVVSDYVAATCETEGQVSYTIKPFRFAGTAYTPGAVESEVIPATGHAYEADYSWDGIECSLTLTCTHDNCQEIKNLDMTVNVTSMIPATYTQEGSTTLLATCVYEGKQYSDTKTIVTPKLTKPAEPLPGETLPAVNVYYITHVQTYGWQGNTSNYKTWKKNGETAGTFGEAKRLESIRIRLDTTADLGVEYRTHVQSYGWEKTYRANGAMSGTSGEAKRLEAISIRLTGSDAGKYDIYYRVHAQTYGWLGWAKNGENAGTAAQAKRLEGIQICVVPKGQALNEGSVGYSYIELGKAATNSNMAGMINYMTHVQSYGDQKYVYDGSVSGTFGEAKRLEGIRINLNPDKTGYSGSVTYRTQVQTYGWLPWSEDGAFNGTHGQGKRLEAIQIRLTGDVANYYDVYYRVHSQTYGWLGWAKNGETAGTVGLAKRLEGIQIVLVPKGQGAPNYLPGKPGMVPYVSR